MSQHATRWQPQSTPAAHYLRPAGDGMEHGGTVTAGGAPATAGASRRAFFGAAGRTACAAVAGSMLVSPWGRLAAAMNLAEDADAIDAHVHVWTPDLDRYPIHSSFQPADMKPASFTPEELFAHTRPNGVARVVLIQMSFYRFDNRYMTDVMAQHPGVFSGVAVIDEHAKHPAQTMRDLAARGVRGFRIHPGNQPVAAWIGSDGMKAMWAAAADQGLAICPLINPEALPAIADMCKRFPRTRVVVDHFARIGIDGQVRPEQLEDLCRLAEFPNTFVKTSAFYALGKKQPPYTDLGPMIRRVLDAFGAERLMWASDCPYQVDPGHNYADSINLIRERLDFLNADQRKWLLRGTAEKVFFA
jgi:predicted TIM-barrel fold metal-dependent hydrolase